MFKYDFKKQVVFMGHNIEKTVTPRKSNIELLRIISMVMIIAHHVAVHSGFAFATDVVTVNELWVLFLRIGGKIGVNIFVLICGYFTINAKTLETSKLLKLWVQILTYSVLIYLALVVCGVEPFGIKALIKNCLPITFSKWWFASAYFVLYLLSPYINKLLNALNKKEYLRLIVLLVVCWSVIPTFLIERWQSNDLLWFVLLYALAGYFKLHVDINKMKKYKCISISLVFIFLTYLSAVIMKVLGLNITFFSGYVTYFYDMQRLPMLLISLTMFIGFLNIDIGHKSVINIVSSATFGIYLIHDNDYIRSLLWTKLFNNPLYADSTYLIPYTIFEIIVVFVVCAAIELIRKYTIEKIYVKWSDDFSSKIDSVLEKAFGRI